MAKELRTKVCIIGSGPAAHTAAIYTARAELSPILFEGIPMGGVMPGGQLTTTTDVENFPGFPKGVLGVELMQKFKDQSEHFNTKIIGEWVERLDLGARPFKVHGGEGTVVVADAIIMATGAVARRLSFKGSDESGFWSKGISACAVCDGAAPIFRNKPLAVIGGGDSAMEEAVFLTKFGSKVYIVHRRDALRASKIMQRRALDNPKIEVLWDSVVTEAYGDNLLKGVKIRNVKSGEERDLELSGLFFAIGHDPASQLVQGVVDLDEEKYIKTVPGSTVTSVPGVFAAGDVQDKKWRQAVTAAGSGCMAALEVEHYLATLEDA
ncbi:unnamed protein product [Ostreobium quekettii]|uniref:Thioredoxin reductase n=1 Tax=Ostreobium quekettii TaxID=121088 RepID=A0A8S1J1Z8_9CHLO|nr:unnamed protein product [Ostreobium quekettii]|eukprot:evm.model.scf_518.2 EVM.evm.TU.scf_518.2   scf_518:14957-16824(+)